MPAPPLAVLTFANPALLWGAAACAIPIAIHLFMRAKPRRQSFPAMQLLMAVKTGSVREHRLRNLLLLLVRMLAIALLVVALARPVSRGSWLAARSRGPTAAALVIDDSASMNQRYAGQTRMEKGRSWATRLLNDTMRFPTGSNFAVLASGYAPAPARLIDAPGEALRTLNAPSDDGHDRSLGAAIDRAAVLLSGAKSNRRELYIVTDNTRAAWSDAAAARWASLTETAVIILDVGDLERDNSRLVNLRLAGTVVPPRTPVKLACTIESGDRAIHTHVDAYLDGAVVARSEPVSITPGGSQEITVALPRLPPGVRAGELRLAGPDANSIDDSLFFALEARQPPHALIVAASPDPADLEEAQRIAALLAPPTMAEDRRPFEVELRSPANGVIDPRPGDAGSVIWIGVPNLDAAQRKHYDDFVRGGGRLLVLPPAALPRDAARIDSLPGRWNRIVTLDKPIAMRWSVPSDGASGATPGVPFDMGFTRREGFDSLASRQVVRHAELVAQGTPIRLAEFENGQPAILARSAGAGVVVQFAFRLDPEWGDLGSRAAAAMVMFHSMVGFAGGSSTRALQLHCGDAVELDCGVRPESDVSVHAGRGKRESLPPQKRRLTSNSRLPIRAISAGVFSIRDTGTDEIVAAYAVNLRDGETLPERMPLDAILAAFAPGAAVVISDPGSLETPTVAVAGDREWDGFLFLALLALLAGEITFANRFYRTR